MATNGSDKGTTETKPKPKNTTAKKTKKPVVEKKHYVNPTETWWGKAIVWIIVFGMVGLIILTFVLSIVLGNA